MTLEILGFIIKPELSIADLAGIAALVISAITFYVGHTRSKKSEQFRFSREIWDRIDEQEKIVEKWTVADDISRERERLNMGESMESLKTELDYFVYLAEKGEIEDTVVSEYYRKRLFRIYATIRWINKQYPHAQKHSKTQDILDLIEKYHKLMNKMKEYRDEFT
jgi:hypothetical protein